MIIENKKQLFIKDNLVNLFIINVEKNAKYLNKFSKYLNDSDFIDITNKSQIINRGILKNILHIFIDIKPKNMIIQNNKYGKPFLLNNKINLNFNISHSEEFMLIGLTYDANIGVDIEKNKYFSGIDKVLERFDVNTKSKKIVNQQRKVFYFYYLWTRMEAYYKYLGTGIKNIKNFRAEYDEYMYTSANNNFTFSVYVKPSKSTTGLHP